MSDMFSLLRCPRSGQPLTVQITDGSPERPESGWLTAPDGSRYPIERGIARLVPTSNYADSFGMQWNHFSATQLDSHSGHPISAERFWHATGWRPTELAGKRVLDVGCGAGRFAEVALEAGGHVVAVDYSTSVDACRKNLSTHPNLTIVQADIYALPFAPGSFDFVYSLGVLQHTPDVARAFAALPPMLAPGGRLCVDFYERSWKSALLPKYWLRPFTKRIEKPRLFAALQRWVPRLLPLSVALRKVPVIGGQLRRLVPVANYVGELPLDERQQLEWALLDTFDWLSPAYDNPQTATTVRGWLESAGLASIEVTKAGHLVGRGRRLGA
jgi:2-polyprenyl-3-methyl-5-hydroxy-6-metoxy-1,4-benzoquinol methylase